MEEKITILNNKKQRLVGWMSRKHPHKIVIITHGFLANKDHPSLVNIATYLIAKGYSTYRFDFSGAGESEGWWPFSIKQQVADIVSVVKYLSYTYREIILVGGSYSAQPAVIACHELTSIKGLTVINGFFGRPKGRLFTIVYETVKAFMRFLPEFHDDQDFVQERLKPDKVKVPVLVVCALEDGVVEYEDSLQFYRILKTEKRLEILEGADHEVTQRKHFLQAVRAFLEWDRASRKALG